MGKIYIRKKIDRTQMNTAIAFAGIVVAAVLRQISRLSDITAVDDAVTLLRPTIYILLFGLWGVSVQKRIVNNNIKKYLVSIAALMLFWICMRTVKYSADNYEVIRYAWYMYYISQILIPTLFFMVSCLVGKEEDKKLSGGKILYPVLLVSIVLVLLVLSNDLHQTVFEFDGRPYTEHNYSHKAVFFCIWGWIVILALISTGMIVKKCRIHEKKKFVILPLIAISLAFLYAVLSAAGNPIIKLVAGDMTVSFCVLYMFIIESCLRSGLILTNTGYDELFKESTIRAQILNEDYETCFSSRNATSYPLSTLKETEWGPVLLDDGIRLSNYKIEGGHFVWQEDTAELYKVMQELDEAKKDLESRNAVLAEAYNTERSLHRLEEQNRLYDSIQEKTKKQIEKLSRLVKDYRKAENHEERAEILRRIIVIGVYIKRRNNLIFISEQNDVIPARELELCFEETLNDLELAGIQCSCFINVGESIPALTVTEIYDFYEKVCEEIYDFTKSFLIRIYKTDNDYCISIDAELIEGAELGIAGDANVIEEDGVYCISAKFTGAKV